MDPKFIQKPIRFISHHWFRGSHKTQTNRQHCHRLQKINMVHIHLTVKTCSQTGKGGQEGAVSLLQEGWWALGMGSRIGRNRHHS